MIASTNVQQSTATIEKKSENKENTPPRRSPRLVHQERETLKIDAIGNEKTSKRCSISRPVAVTPKNQKRGNRAVSAAAKKRRVESKPERRNTASGSSVLTVQTRAPLRKLETRLQEVSLRKSIVDWDQVQHEYVVYKKSEKPNEVVKPRNERTSQPVGNNKNCGPGDIQTTSNSSLDSETGVSKILNNHRNFIYYKPNSEAARANRNGSFNIGVRFPAIPGKKYGSKDLPKYGQGNESWPVQAVFKTRDPKKYLVLYEGWAADTGCVQTAGELKKSAPLMVKRCQERADIIKALEKQTGKCFTHDMETLQKNPEAGVWVMEDITYFHNIYQFQNNQAAVYYLTSNSSLKKFPMHTFIHQNVVDKNAEQLLLENPIGDNIELVMERVKAESNRNSLERIPRKSACPSENCKCDMREQLVYKSAMSYSKRINYNKHGKLVLQEKVIYNRYVLECSDACGCDESCPTRILQRGQQIPLVVSYEDNGKGFGVRAGRRIRRGEFIAEYTGIVRLTEDPSYKNATYLAECSVVIDGISIDSLKKGNVARFINHSCDGNTLFITVHSRVLENEPLVPRIAVFASKDIAKGDEITLSYYNEDTLRKAAKANKKNKIPCHCNTSKCRKWIPTA